MSTDVEKFVRKKKARPLPPDGEAAHQGHVPEPPPPPHKEAEHQGRVPQPSVPSGPRNSPKSKPKVKAKVRRERHNRAVAKSLAPPKFPKPKSANELAKEFPGVTKVEAAKAIKKSESGLDAGDVAKFAADEAKSVWKAAQEAQAQQSNPLAYRGPSRNQLEAGLAEASFLPVAEAGKGVQALSKAATAASDASTAAKAGAKVVAKLKGAPKAAARDVKAYPAKKVRAIKSAPRRAKETVKRAPELKTPAGRRAAGKSAGKTAVHHPIKTGVPAVAALPTGNIPGDPGKRARGAIVGTADAIINHPGETFRTTARALPAAITGPVALGAAGVDSVLKGTPAPLVNTAKEEAKGVAAIVGKTFSGNPKDAEEAARKEGSLSFLTPLPAVSKLKPYERARSAARDLSGDVRRKLASRSDNLNRRVRHAPKGVEEPAFAITARRDQRKRTAKTKQRADNPARVANAHYDSRTNHALAKGPKGAHVALQTVAEYGIRDKKGADLVRAQGPGDPQLLKALDYMEAHPELFDSKDFHAAVAATKENSENAPAAHAGKGRRARLMPHGDLFGIARPEERIPFNQRDLFDGATTWAEAVKKLDALKQGHLTTHRQAKEEARIAKSGLDQTRKVRSRNTGRVARAGVKVSDRTPRLGRTDRGGGRRAFVFDRSTGRLEIGSRGTSHSDVFKADEMRGPSKSPGEIDNIDGHEVFKLGGPYDDISPRDVQRALQAVREHTGEDIRTAEQWRTGKTPTGPRVKGTAALTRAEREHYFAQARYKKAREKLKAVKDDRAELQKLRDTAKRNHDRIHTEAGAQKYDNRVLDEYEREVETARSGSTLAPSIFTHHLEADSHRGLGFQQRFTTSGANKEYMRTGKRAAEGNIDRSLPGLLQGYNSSRLRGAGRQSMRQIVKDNMKPFEIDGKTKTIIPDNQTWQKITKPKSEDNPDGGQYDPTHYARLALRSWKRAVEDPYLDDASRAQNLTKILQDADADRVQDHEPSVLVPREVVRELEQQLNPNHNRVVKTLNTASRVATRTLLGTNPAWALAQTVAEGVPLLLAHPELALDPTKLYRIEKDLHRYRKENPEGALALQATAGASPVGAAALRTPLDEQERYTPDEWAKGADAMTRGKTARSAISFAKLRTLGEFDVRRQNAYRQALFAAEADKRFRNFHGSLTSLFDRQADLSKKFRGKSRAELYDWLNDTAEGRVQREKLADYVDNIQGDWTSFTSHERSLAPLVLFYPFLRYSLRWTLWTFPKTHPATATIAYMLGQANSNQLESLLGKTAYEEGLAATDEPMRPGNPLAWALPVYTNEKGEKGVLPGGSRISPGQSALTQAAATGNWAQILSSSNPAIGAAITGLTGVEPLTGEKSSLPKGIAMLNQLFSMPSVSRVKLPDAVPVVGGRTLQHAATEALSGRPQSALSKKFESYDPSKNLRSVALPGIPLAGTKWADSELLGKAVDQKFADPIPGLPPEVTTAIYGVDGKGGWVHGEKGPLEELIKQHKLSKKEGELVTAAEKPYFAPEPGLTKKQEELEAEAYELAQGGILIKPETPAEKKKREREKNPFGLPETGSAKFEEEFGIPNTSVSKFKEEFGIE